MTIHYVISVSAKGVLPEGESKGMGELERRFGLVQELPGVWYLSPGMDEKIYRASSQIPLGKGELEEIETIFSEEKRNIVFYKLEKV